MSKKQEEKETVKVQKEEETVKVQKEEKTVKKKSNKSSKKDEDIKTLIDLVESSNLKRAEIIINLSKANYLKQFYEEEEMRKKGLAIKPTMTEIEFKKIIGE